MRGPVLAVAVVLGVIAVGLAVSLMAGQTDAPPAQQPDPIDMTLPIQPIDPVFPVQPGGSGPALVWQAAPLPLGGTRAEWLVADHDRFYMSIIGSSQLGPGTYWLSSEDGRSWTDITPSDELRPMVSSDRNSEITAWNGVVIAVSFPDVLTLDSRTGRFEIQQLQLPDSYTDPQTWCEPDGLCRPEVTVTAGDRGALLIVEGPDPGSLAAWHSNDGFEWSPLTEIPGDRILVLAAAVDGGFILTGLDRGGCGVWHSRDAMKWEHIHTLNECPRGLVAWKDEAVAVHLGSLWRISTKTVTPILPEELSVLRRGEVTVGAGENGIVVPYEAIQPDWDFEDGLWPPLNAVVEFSTDGRVWSRRVLPDPISDASNHVEIAGTTVVLLTEHMIYIGTPEP
ncbi:MAG: hypothetical protein R3258_05045 [Acidimicrobiia bacterium]|nr:hypothetical protein [Acidimicrobiia bacterium]